MRSGKRFSRMTTWVAALVLVAAVASFAQKKEECATRITLLQVNDVYQFRVTLGSGATQGRINAMALVIDAPDLIESVNDLVVSSTGTAIPYTGHFAAIKNIQATLQANGTGAVTVEIDKTAPLAPTAKCFNAAHTAVGGATVDFYLKGY